MEEKAVFKSMIHGMVSVPKGVTQGCVPAPLLFNIGVYWLMNNFEDAATGGNELNTILLGALKCINDIALLA